MSMLRSGVECDTWKVGTRAVSTPAASEEGAAAPRRLHWRCPICEQRLVLRHASEDEAAFQARCEAHQSARRVCDARALIKQLTAAGLVPLRRKSVNDYMLEYLALNDAGLVEWHMTHIIGDNYVRRTPWGPVWAARYDAYLRHHRKQTLKDRVTELREAAATPEGMDRALAFLVLARVEVDVGGEA